MRHGPQQQLDVLPQRPVRDVKVLDAERRPPLRASRAMGRGRRGHHGEADMVVRARRDVDGVRSADLYNRDDVVLRRSTVANGDVLISGILRSRLHLTRGMTASRQLPGATHVPLDELSQFARRFPALELAADSETPPGSTQPSMHAPAHFRWGPVGHRTDSGDHASRRRPANRSATSDQRDALKIGRAAVAARGRFRGARPHGRPRPPHSAAAPTRLDQITPGAPRGVDLCCTCCAVQFVHRAPTSPDYSPEFATRAREPASPSDMPRLGAAAALPVRRCCRRAEAPTPGHKHPDDAHRRGGALAPPA
jgi:hypothetical protein